MKENTTNKNWFNRNWKWALPVGGCLIILIAFFALAGTIFYGVSSMFSESEPYETAFELANADEQVIKNLGSPLETNGMIKGSINYKNSNGEAFFEIPVKGSKGEGLLIVDATKTNGEWSYSTLKIEVEDTEEVIHLIPENLLD